MDMPLPNFLSHNPKGKTTAKMSSRNRPLHACGVSILAIIDIVIGKTQHISGGPLDSTFKRVLKLAKFATPLIYAMQFQWLTILSLIDDAILAIENLLEKLFPPSTRVFNKVDEIVLMIVSLPENFDGALNKFPTMIHKVPFLDWALTLVISRLNCLVSTLNHWGQENSRVNEKTIGVDRSSNEEYVPMHSSENITSENLESFPSITSECELKGVHDLELSSQLVKGSFKETLEKGKEENPNEKMEKECEIKKKIDGGDECECEEEKKKNGRNNECGDDIKYLGRSESVKDSLLELFESAWLMKPGSY